MLSPCPPALFNAFAALFKDPTIDETIFTSSGETAVNSLDGISPVPSLKIYFKALN
nr:MAG TPA: hypothetical protein [Caudoviricetes sp.]